MRDWRPRFLKALSTAPNVAAACRAAGISRKAAYDARKRDPDFAEAWEEALQGAVDDLIGEAYRRARHGVEKPVLYKGRPAGDWVLPDGSIAGPGAEGARFRPITIREYSGTLLMFLVKAYRPEFRDRAQLSGPHAAPARVRIDNVVRPAQALPAPGDGG
jgi:hypothetical protein